MSLLGRRWTKNLFLALGCWLWISTPAWALDTVVLKSGDTLRGEIKKVEKEVLHFDTDYADEVFKIKWEKVARLESDHTFLMEVYSGRRYTGVIQTDEEPKEAAPMMVTANTGDQEVPYEDLSQLQAVETSFWSRFDADLDGGLTVTKANASRQFNLGAGLEYFSEKNLLSERFDILVNTQGNEEAEIRTDRWESKTQYRRLVGEKWYAITNLDLLRSSEQELDLRTTVQGGAGRFLLNSSTEHLSLAGGGAWTSERYEDPETPLTNSAEAWTGVEYYTERLRIADFSFTYVVLPSLTRRGRVRMNFNTELKFNLPGEWDFKFRLYNNFDSDPVVEGVPRNDSGLVTSFGWEL